MNDTNGRDDGKQRAVTSFPLDMPWQPARPLVLVAACSDGRLQEATDAFLARALGVRHYDRFYVPGGGGALSAGGCDFIRAHAQRRECRFLVEAHQVEHLVLLFHGPAADGPAEAVCADYRRRMSWARPAQVRAQQEADVRDLLARRNEFAGAARVSVYRFEVTAAGDLAVATLHEDVGRVGDGVRTESARDETRRPVRETHRPAPKRSS